MILLTFKLGGMCTLDLMSYLDTKIGRGHLLKRSVLLLKAFFTNEVSMLGAQISCMATYALYTLVIFILNCYGKSKDLQSEMAVLRCFFEVFGEFDWEQHMVTIYGPVRLQGFYDRLRDNFDFDLDRLAMSERRFFFKYDSNESSREDLLVPPEHLAPFIEKYACLKLLSFC